MNSDIICGIYFNSENGTTWELVRHPNGNYRCIYTCNGRSVKTDISPTEARAGIDDAIEDGYILQNDFDYRREYPVNHEGAFIGGLPVTPSNGLLQWLKT